MLKNNAIKSPDQLFGQLFSDLHLSGIWSDGKVISDATPLFDVETINAAYNSEKQADDFDLKVFFENHFQYFSVPGEDFKSDTSMSVEEHINTLWKHLRRESDTPIEGSSLIALPNAYIVPGGRFNEIYYWDSYFTMLGLIEVKNFEMIESMIDNFAWQIRKFGFIPNGNRTYFLGRSQPPFFSLMVSLLAEHKGDSIYIKYFDTLLMEYSFWMSADEQILDMNKCDAHVVQCNETILNRYFDKFDSARPEMFGDDIKVSKGTIREDKVLFSNLRSGCESGWDFSSRWLDGNLELSTIHALDILPIDLNCLLYNLEKTIAKVAKIKNNHKLEDSFETLAAQRSVAVQSLFWNSDRDFFFDFNFKTKSLKSVESLAALFPLFFNIASDVQAKSVAEKIEQVFLKPGGLLTTTIQSGQQWDAPNGWAPLQYIAVKGLENYGYKNLSNEIKSRWLALNDKVFQNTGKMLEKYNVVDVNLESGGGEYPVQDGFGWTNGVYLSFLYSNK